MRREGGSFCPKQKSKLVQDLFNQNANFRLRSKLCKFDFSVDAIKLCSEK